MNTDSEDAVVTQERPFSQWLAEQRQGALHGELTAALAEVTRAVVEHGKPGTVTLKISLKPLKDHPAGVLQVVDDVAMKAPQATRGSALWHADDEGNLSRENPRQARLPLQEVPRSSAELREVGGA